MIIQMDGKKYYLCLVTTNFVKPHYAGPYEKCEWECMKHNVRGTKRILLAHMKKEHSACLELVQ